MPPINALSGAAPGTPRVADASRISQALAVGSSGTGAPAGSPGTLPSPTLRLDPQLQIVVLEFRDQSGSITSTVPSQRQLDAYRQSQYEGTGTRTKAGRGTVPAAVAAPDQAAAAAQDRAQTRSSAAARLSPNRR